MFTIIGFLPGMGALVVALLLAVGELFLAERAAEALLAPLPPLVQVAQRNALKLLPCTSTKKIKQK
jgi:hypothetical protein